jgi:hypothetical protein
MFRRTNLPLSRTRSQVRLRDGTATGGIVRRILGNEVLIAWDGIPGDPHWYHQDYVAAEINPDERGRVRPPPVAPAYKAEARPNPFKIGEAVRLRDGTAANGIVTEIFGSEVGIAWEGVPSDPQWYHQDFVLAEKRAAQRAPALRKFKQKRTSLIKHVALSQEWTTARGRVSSPTSGRPTNERSALTCHVGGLILRRA